MPTTTDKDGTTPYLPTTTGRRIRPHSLSATIERMLLHPIYHQLLEGGYDPLVYQLVLKGCFYILFTSYYCKEDTTPRFISGYLKDTSLIAIVGILDNTERGGASVLKIFNK